MELDFIEQGVSADPHDGSLSIILAELERIDFLIQLQVWRARNLNLLDENFQGLYIAEEEIDALLGEPAGLPRWAGVPLPLNDEDVSAALQRIDASIACRSQELAALGAPARLDRLCAGFDLGRFERDALLICLAPEIDLRYERFFGYLQDDVTKRRPSVDLVLNLLCPTFEAKLTARRHFASHAPLLSHRLLHLYDDPSQPHPPLLSQYLKVDTRVVDHLFNADEIDAALAPYAQIRSTQVEMEDLLLPADVKQRLARLSNEAHDSGSGLILYFQGPYGVGKETTAAALCVEAGMRLLTVDGEKLLNAEELAFETAIILLQREALLQRAVIYWQGFDALLSDERRPWREMLLRALEARPGLTILAGDTVWEPVDALHDLPFVRVEFPRPTYAERRQFWPMSLNGDMPMESDVDLGALASKFRFTAGQIRDAAATARNLARWRDPENREVTTEDLYAASRLQSNRKLGELARKITPHYVWDDIVLPADRMRQLREIVNQIKYRSKVYEEWGFDRKLAMGKGLNALFAGPSGTGKTMAADIMAGELGLDLYKIDLSAVVSKYIGETEKNLARIFVEAETSNAILFFDEADALFGKRSEVRDAHDRYANIEISYLLQRMEEYDGMVILATNLSKNLDDAFVRRMHFAIEFPFPDQTHRRHIWEKIWQAETPMSLPERVEGNDMRQAVDLDFMAQRFDLAGGNIRNIALAAAFLAADDGEVVQMGHLIRAVQREYQKMGKVVVEGEFQGIVSISERQCVTEEPRETCKINSLTTKIRAASICCASPRQTMGKRPKPEPCPPCSATPRLSYPAALATTPAPGPMPTLDSPAVQTAPDALLRLQRDYGNRFVQRVVDLSRQGEGDVTSEVEQSIQSARGGGQLLDSNVRAQMEPAFGADFGGVRVHSDSGADSLNRSLSARAFTTGQDIFFKQGKYNPGTSGGRQLLAHELTHVVQQNGDQVQTKLTVGAPGDRYEQEADSVARAVIQQESQPVQKGEEGQVRRQLVPEEEEEPIRAKLEELQRQPEEEEELLQSKQEAIQRQIPEEEEN